MKYFLPRSLAGQTILVLVAGLVTTHVVAIAIFSEHRAQSLTRADEQHIARHITSISDIVMSVPDQWKERIVSASDDHSFRVYLTPNKPGTNYGTIGDRAKTLKNLLSRRMRTGTKEPISININHVNPNDQLLRLDYPGNWLWDFFNRLIYGHDREQTVFVSVPLSQQQRLNFSTVMPLTDAPGWEQTLATTVLFVIVVLLLSLWIVRRMSAPLNRFATAATAFAQNVYAPALPETGPSEVQRAAQAFNDMQRKIQQLLESRAQMLAAISHDLRTPLTTIRLRAETIEQPELRIRMLAALGEMDTMLTSTLSYAHEGSDNEEKSLTDIGSLVEAICEDMSDNGHHVTSTIETGILLLCRPIALKRALTNLIDNAVKYGHRAHVYATAKDSNDVEITIDDEGPGIPERQMDLVFLPFHRLETSRSQNTGGIGIGMAIAQMIIDAHGGSVHLSNRSTGGLRVQVRLPHSDALNVHTF